MPCNKMADGPSLLWFRCDLRLADHPALTAAVIRSRPIIPVFIWGPEEDGDEQPGAASRWWLHQSLVELDRDLRSRGLRLVIRRGPTQESLTEILKTTGADAVYWNRRYEPALSRRDAQIEQALRRSGIEAQTFPGNVLFEPHEIRTKEGNPYRVFTPFWKACRARGEPGKPLPAPRRLIAPSQWPRSLEIAELQLEPKIDWAAGFRATWRPGARGAAKQIERFHAQALSAYARGRDRPDSLGTSRLSPHLHFGEITPRQVWHALGQPGRKGRGAKVSTAARSKFFAELGWREFAHHVLFHFPYTSDRPLRDDFKKFPWRRDARALKAWQRGQTGFPIVDAGMRELWTTGWMHNRVRMIVASFLTKDLLITWREGARWFWDTLVDADLANNTLGWQWTAGCGADAAPFFRIFNPVLQGRKFDPEGVYVRRWVPELAKLPLKFVHEPWKTPSEVLSASNVRLGDNYPRPIVSHAESRHAALEAFRSLRS
ncbi:MAG TPA: deoxyribodipyrimidine photo-lyase [Planctomycetaceae bacterium]|nr:deoxyribodipyrimidine photo-lyase [Planctomycetaceae bacterium]